MITIEWAVYRRAPGANAKYPQAAAMIKGV